MDVHTQTGHLSCVYMMRRVRGQDNLVVHSAGLFIDMGIVNVTVESKKRYYSLQMHIHIYWYVPPLAYMYL